MSDSPESPNDAPEAPPYLPSQPDPVQAAEDALAHESVRQRIKGMTVPEKLKLALTGSAEERQILIRDSNKTVTRAVIESPRVSEREAELYASMTDLSDEIYRLIAKNHGFIKNYPIVLALVTNPRVPIDLTIPLVVRLKTRDLQLAKANRNLPTAIRTLADRIKKTSAIAGLDRQ
jgi:hypothetical protein